MALPEFKLAIRSARRGSKASNSTSSTSETLHPLLKTRKRALTLPLSSPVKIGMRKRALQKTFEQEQAPIFQILPYDIRVIIWEMVLSGHHIHIFNWGKLGHLVCSPADAIPMTLRQACLFLHSTNGPTRDGAAHRGPIKLLPLIRCCRRVYSETITILYSRNTFDFNSLSYPMEGIPKQVLPHRWSLLRYVSLTWYFQSWVLDPWNPIISRKWDRTCDILSEMTGLRKLAIGLITASSTVEKTCIFEMLGPLETIKVNGPFDVYVSWEENDTTGEAEKTFINESIPFTLHRIPENIAELHRNKVIWKF